MRLTVHECVSEVGKQECKTIKGQCVAERDGYFIVSTICIVAGVTIWLAFVRPTALKLQGEWLAFPELCLGTDQFVQLYHS